MALFAAVQMNSGADVAANLEAARRLLARAARAGAALAVLPENFACMGEDDGARARIAETPGEGPVQDFLAATARRLGIWLVGGTLPLASDDPARPYAACLVYDAEGAPVARYDKLHLFDVALPGGDERYRESANTTPGERRVIVPTPFGRLAIAVCYDLRFPELLRGPADEPPDFVAVPAAFTVPTGRDHWETLLAARAIENQCAVIAAAQGGRHPAGRTTWGRSMIIDAWGERRSLGNDRPGVLVAEFDAARQRALRARFPVLRHRRIDTRGPGAAAH